MEEFKEYLPFFNELKNDEKEKIINATRFVNLKKGKVLHGGDEDCIGLIIVKQGRLRAYMTSDEGKEITLYNLLERDMCLFSASCIMNNIDFDVLVSSEEETEIYIVNPVFYKELMDTSLPCLKYTNNLMASRFSDVMWLVDQILNKRIDERLSALIIEESSFNKDEELNLTHDKLASHLGTAREVVTRMLKYLNNEGLIEVSRGKIKIKDYERLENLAKNSLK